MGKKIISFAGVKREDLIYYLSKLLATCNQPILVVDNSYQNTLFRCVWVNEEDPDVYVRNIAFIRNAKYDKDLTEPFEYTIVFHGERINKEWWDASEDKFLILNFDKFDNEDMRESIRKNVEGQVNIIFTERYSDKVKDSSIVESFGISLEDVPYAYEIPVDEEIERMRLALQYNALVRVEKVAPPMKKVLWNLYKLISNADKKQKQQNIFKQAG